MVGKATASLDAAGGLILNDKADGRAAEIGKHRPAVVAERVEALFFVVRGVAVPRVDGHQQVRNSEAKIRRRAGPGHFVSLFAAIILSVGFAAFSSDAR